MRLTHMPTESQRKINRIYTVNRKKIKSEKELNDTEISYIYLMMGSKQWS